ncbi:outer membrane exchange protein TraA family protein [Sorangium sp. So ce394]|uniref:outer membrane exchange protein TraA family protein n=1 Tax=Sorangium sp. So ce394 TaxID=3133310 RepID=UPI003F5C7248
MRNRRAVLATAALFTLLPASAYAVPVKLYTPYMDPLEIEGTGLCSASAISTDPLRDFGLLTAETYNSGVNAFMEEHKTYEEGRFEKVVRTVFDLSNNNNTGLQLSHGDFTGSMSPECEFGGCAFYREPDPDNPGEYVNDLNDPNTSFATRFRGFLNVTPDLSGKPIHFGFYTDDAVSLTFYDLNLGAVTVLVRPTRLGQPTWRTTNTVTFEKPGLYPVEILYVAVAEHSALEMSYLIGDFTDYELGTSEPGARSLASDGFTLFQPTQFFQTLSGSPSFPDLDQCQQCNRAFIGDPGNHGCPGSYYCNEAALCAPCDTAFFCGESCSRCEGDKQFCINLDDEFQCAECRTDADCDEGFSCDPETHVCNECNVDPDCPRGEICVEHTCTPCDTADRCAGNSCNCCPNGINGTQMDCAAVEPGGIEMCVECLTDAQCPGDKVCHVPTGHCVDRPLPTNALPNCCGEGCVDCMHPEDPNDPQTPPVPFCLPGPVGTACAACRNDMDCSEGQYCLSGECKACVEDRRCGTRCDSCGGDTPFCSGQFAEFAVCVRCTSDEQCAGTTCNPETHECDPGCMATCGEDTPYCDGQRCVECYADTQCPCGNTCDLETNTCDISCKSNLDCLGNEHCRWTDEADAKECALGPMPDNVACGGTLAEICSVSVVGEKGADPRRPAGLLALAMLALLERTRRRRSGGAS